MEALGMLVVALGRARGIFSSGWEDIWAVVKAVLC
jgi:hypothetical protein